MRFNYAGFHGDDDDEMHRAFQVLRDKYVVDFDAASDENVSSFTVHQPQSEKYCTNLIFTSDGPGAVDLDDGLSLEELTISENWVIGF